MTGPKMYSLRFNSILQAEMRKGFDLQPLALDADFRLKYSDKKNKDTFLKAERLECPKTAGIRFGEMNFEASMCVHFGSVPPGPEYDIPILGYTFVLADRFLICVLDLHPLSRERAYRDKYLQPLKEISKNHQWIPRAEGGRSQVHDWAVPYDSGYSFYRWCEGQYLGEVENIFRDYVHVFCDCIEKAEPVTDPAALSANAAFLEKYRYDYAYKDPGSNPLKSHFGQAWGERFMNRFLFAP